MADDTSQQHAWMADSDEDHYELRVERGQVSLIRYSPPEFHYQLSDDCSAAEFVGGKLNERVRQIFGATSFAQAIDVARAELATK
jgi:hypothetical protein